MTKPCPKCAESMEHSLDGMVCYDCWPGYNLCADERCDHYRCEHFDEGCGNADCPCAGFVEGSTRRVMTTKEFEALKKSWEEPSA